MSLELYETSLNRNQAFRFAFAWIAAIRVADCAGIQAVSESVDSRLQAARMPEFHIARR
jgi:hypothetical protein